MTRLQFIKFLKEFKFDFERNEKEWANKSLGDFLESLARYTEDIQGFYDNTNSEINADIPTWENFKNILKGASIYE